MALQNPAHQRGIQPRVFREALDGPILPFRIIECCGDLSDYRGLVNVGSLAGDYLGRQPWVMGYRGGALHRVGSKSTVPADIIRGHNPTHADDLEMTTFPLSLTEFSDITHKI